MVSGFGVTCGAHRLWAHRSYKAKLPLRIFLAIGQSIAGQNCLYIWCRDHRVHHKFSDTDADPHNSKRGVFFSHVGWLLHKKHPDVIEQGKKLNCDDLLSDPVVYWQQVLYYPSYLIFAFFIPVAVPVYFWNESLATSFFVNYIFRHAFGEKVCISIQLLTFLMLVHDGPSSARNMVCELGSPFMGC